MNSSLNKRIYSYLGFRSVEKNADTDAAIAVCLEELEELAHFRYIYKYFQTPPEFLNKQPYADYLKGSSGVIIAVMTLGAEVDARIKFLSRMHPAKSLVFDACASAYLEELSDEYEKGLNLELSYRFCPGYGGSDISDLKYIFQILKPEKIGVTLTQTGYMLPSKTMAGVIAVGNSAQKNCKNCAVFEHCEYRQEGGTCYGSEKK